MALRYIFSTSGEYVAFLANNNLFAPNAEWLGFVRSGNQVYLKDGSFVGYLLNDGRIARKKDELTRPKLLKPLEPLKPLIPLQPMRRLPMSPLLHPFEDVFEMGLISPRKVYHQGVLRSFNDFLESKIVANDGAFLGKISKDKYRSDSISNQYGTYGSRYNSVSLLNPYGPYGSPYSSSSAFNPYATHPPEISKDGKVLGFLTKNKYIQGNVDPDELFLWLGLK